MANKGRRFWSSTMLCLISSRFCNLQHYQATTPSAHKISSGLFTLAVLENRSTERIRTAIFKDELIRKGVLWSPKTIKLSEK